MRGDGCGHFIVRLSEAKKRSRPRACPRPRRGWAKARRAEVSLAMGKWALGPETGQAFPRVPSKPAGAQLLERAGESGTRPCSGPPSHPPPPAGSPGAFIRLGEMEPRAVAFLLNTPRLPGSCFLLKSSSSSSTPRRTLRRPVSAAWDPSASPESCVMTL